MEHNEEAHRTMTKEEACVWFLSQPEAKIVGTFDCRSGGIVRSFYIRDLQVSFLVKPESQNLDYLTVFVLPTITALRLAVECPACTPP